MTNPLAPPGWYPDYQNPQQLRYWDGVKWSEHTHAARPGVVPSGPARTDRGLRLPWWQTWFAIIPGLLLLIPGLYALWRRPVTTNVVKIVVTAATVVLFTIAIAAPDGSEPAANNVAGSSPSETPAATPSSTPEAPKAPARARVPAVTGLDLAHARRALVKAGLQVGALDHEPSAKPAGTVLRQTQAKGSQLLLGSQVRLVVAVPYPRVPSVTDETQRSAVRLLRRAGFDVDVSVETVTSGVSGVVLRQEPASGVRFEPNSVVHIVIANVVRPVVSVPVNNCTPGYSPCLAPASDYDCAGGSGNGPAYANGPIYISGSDPYDLDSDGDGVGCES
jgi:resuscitation-promoting factor RpfB